MNPIYIDLHIHTSENPNNLVENYDIECLIEKINKVSDNSDFLISLTDHNTINKKVYLEIKDRITYLLLGVELHVRNYPESAPYHCHIYFNVENITEAVIDDINSKLDRLYSVKVISHLDTSIPTLETIIKTFDSYDFILLPHGGQSHSTFDKSIPEGTQFDTRIERSIYYNQFDGFTARSNTGLERTIEYFEKLGINEFVNLITCTDNYNPNKYPNAKDSNAEPFLPTWMLALPTFDGLRLSLSESSRLIYSEKKPNSWSEYITKATLDNEFLDIKVALTPGLNVIIGGSSSGKTLFVDSVFNKINNDFSESVYKKYGVENINVANPSGIKPHFITQNYIVKIVDNNNTENSIDDIAIIKNVFPGDEEIRNNIDKGLLKLKTDLKELIKSVKTIETEGENLKRIPILSRLITNKDVQENILAKFLPNQDTKNQVEYSKLLKDSHIEVLNDIDEVLEKNPFVNHNPNLISELKEEILLAYRMSNFEKSVRDVIIDKKEQLDADLLTTNNEQQTKKQNFDKLLNVIKVYSKALDTFYKTLNLISEYSIKFDSQVVESMGHKLFIENNFTLNKTMFVEVINKFLKTNNKIIDFNNLRPENLFEVNFKKQLPNVKDYDDFEIRINKEFESLNKKTYKIITSDDRNFEDLSAGWKTSVILDIILGYEGDMAPLIIDQPEDNLATNYINKGLINAIKKIKSKKQIILVSHNATIPMLGDAQNVVLCRNEKGKIIIRSDRLEGKIDNKSIVDYIADITDGGKRSIKKRVKKYNLKNFRD